MIQEIVTYFIILATVIYVAFKTVKLFAKKGSDSGCVSSGCSGCSVQGACSDPIKFAK